MKNSLFVLVRVFPLQLNKETQRGNFLLKHNINFGRYPLTHWRLILASDKLWNNWILRNKNCRFYPASFASSDQFTTGTNRRNNYSEKKPQTGTRVLFRDRLSEHPPPQQTNDDWKSKTLAVTFNRQLLRTWHHSLVNFFSLQSVPQHSLVQVLFFSLVFVHLYLGLQCLDHKNNSCIHFILSLSCVSCFVCITLHNRSWDTVCMCQQVGYVSGLKLNWD